MKFCGYMQKFYLEPQCFARNLKSVLKKRLSPILTHFHIFRCSGSCVVSLSIHFYDRRLLRAKLLAVSSLLLLLPSNASEALLVFILLVLSYRMSLWWDFVSFVASRVHTTAAFCAVSHPLFCQLSCVSSTLPKRLTMKLGIFFSVALILFGYSSMAMLMS